MLRPDSRRFSEHEEAFLSLKNVEKKRREEEREKL